MNYILESGRPSNCDFRTETEMRCYNVLDGLNIEFYRVDHLDTPADTMEICTAIDKTLGCAICKNLFLTNRQKTAFYLLMMPADKPFKTKDLSAQINSSRLSFADSDLMQKHLGVKPGSVSVLGLINDSENSVKLLVDEELLTDEYIGCHPCVNTTSLKIKTEDLFDEFLKRVNHTKTVINLPRY